MAQLEEKKDSVTKSIKEKAACQQPPKINVNDADSDASEEDLEDLTDWRKKC